MNPSELVQEFINSDCPQIWTKANIYVYGKGKGHIVAVTDRITQERKEFTFNRLFKSKLREIEEDYTVAESQKYRRWEVA